MRSCRGSANPPGSGRWYSQFGRVGKTVNIGDPFKILNDLRIQRQFLSKMNTSKV